MKTKLIPLFAALLCIGGITSCSFFPKAEKPADPALYEAHKAFTQALLNP